MKDVKVKENVVGPAFADSGRSFRKSMDDLTEEDIRKIRESMDPPLDASNSRLREKDFFAVLDGGANKLWNKDGEFSSLSSFFKIGGERPKN